MVAGTCVGECAVCGFDAVETCETCALEAAVDTFVHLMDGGYTRETAIRWAAVYAEVSMAAVAEAVEFLCL